MRTVELSLLFLIVLIAFSSINGTSRDVGNGTNTRIQQTVPNSQLNQPLQPLGNQSYSFITQPKKGLAMPDDKVNYTFSPSGQFSFRNQQGDNFTLKIPQSFLKNNLLFNSTTVEVIFKFGSSNLTIFFKTMSASLNLKITVAGYNGFGSPVPLVWPLGNFLNRPVRVTATGVFFGSLGFDWGDSLTFNPVWNNATQTLTWTVPVGRFSIDPLAQDGALVTGTSLGQNTCSTGTMNMANTKDVMLLMVGLNSSSFTDSPAQVTDTFGLTWYLESKEIYIPTLKLLVYWAVEGANSGSDTITWTIGSTASTCVIEAVAISGAASNGNETTPVFMDANYLDIYGNGYHTWKSNVGNSLSATSSTPFNTLNTNDFVFVAGITCGTALATPAGYTGAGISRAGATACLGGSEASQIAYVSTTATNQNLNGVAMAVTNSGASNWVVLVGALRAAPTLTSITPTLGPSATRVTITGTNFQGPHPFVRYAGAVTQISTFTVLTDATISATVFNGAFTTGNITVVNIVETPITTADVYTFGSAGSPPAPPAQPSTPSAISALQSLGSVAAASVVTVASDFATVFFGSVSGIIVFAWIDLVAGLGVYVTLARLRTKRGQRFSLDDVFEDRKHRVSFGNDAGRKKRVGLERDEKPRKRRVEI